MTRRAAAVAVALALVPGCGGEVGTIQVSLVTAPASDLLERIQRVRAVLSEPYTVIEAERDASGALHIDFEVTAQNAPALVTVEGFDAADQRIALALSAPLPLAAVDFDIALYVAPPLSFAEAPVALESARSEIGAALLPYGAILMGGRDAGGDPIADVVVYNVYDHSLQEGLPLPEARASATVVSGESDLVYVFGGLDQTGGPNADGWSFNTALAPAGAYVALTSDGDLARAGAAGVFVASERFLITGTPAVQVDGLTGQVSAWPGAPPMEEGAAARLLGTGDVTMVLIAGSGVGENGAVSTTGDAYSELDAPAEVRRTGHAVVALPDGRGLVVGGTLESGERARSAVAFDPGDGQFSVHDDFLTAARPEAAIAASQEYVLVAGGVDPDGAVRDDAELFDVTSLEPVATLPLVAPRRGASALVLANGQVLIAGGIGPDGAPVAVLELFTPAGP